MTFILHVVWYKNATFLVVYRIKNATRFEAVHFREKQTETENMKILTRQSILPHRPTLISSIGFGVLRKLGPKRWFSAHSEEPELKELMEYMDSLKNYEKVGVPKGAGTDSDDGFDLGRMRRLVERLGNPQSQFKVQNPTLFFFFCCFVWFLRKCKRKKRVKVLSFGL